MFLTDDVTGADEGQFSSFFLQYLTKTDSVLDGLPLSLCFSQSRFSFQLPNIPVSGILTFGTSTY